MPSVEPDHVCVRRPCLLCALDRGLPLPARTRFTEPQRPKVLLWRAREPPPDVKRLIEKLSRLPKEAMRTIELLVDDVLASLD